MPLKPLKTGIEAAEGREVVPMYQLADFECRSA